MQLLIVSLTRPFYEYYPIFGTTDTLTDVVVHVCRYVRPIIHAENPLVSSCMFCVTSEWDEVFESEDAWAKRHWKE